MYRAIQNWSNLFLCILGFAQISLNILIQLLKLNNNFKYFIHGSRILTQGVEGGSSPPHVEICFDFKL